MSLNSIKDIEPLETDEVYIYVILNDEYKIKIGKTKNIKQRVRSLSGSNSLGHKIIDVYCSPATYMYTMEKSMHSIFDRYRIEGTEWFQGDDLYFDDVVDVLNGLFTSGSYNKCNELRKKAFENIANK